MLLQVLTTCKFQLFDLGLIRLKKVLCLMKEPVNDYRPRRIAHFPQILVNGPRQRRQVLTIDLVLQKTLLLDCVALIFLGYSFQVEDHGLLFVSLSGVLKIVKVIRGVYEMLIVPHCLVMVIQALSDEVPVFCGFVEQKFLLRDNDWLRWLDLNNFILLLKLTSCILRTHAGCVSPVAIYI